MAKSKKPRRARKTVTLSLNEDENAALSALALHLHRDRANLLRCLVLNALITNPAGLALYHFDEDTMTFTEWVGMNIERAKRGLALTGEWPIPDICKGMGRAPYVTGTVTMPLLHPKPFTILGGKRGKMDSPFLPPKRTTIELLGDLVESLCREDGWVNGAVAKKIRKLATGLIDRADGLDGKAVKR